MALSKICAHCGKEFFKSSHLAFVHWSNQRFCSHKYHGRNKPALVVEYRGTNYDGIRRPLHRVLMEEHLGRKLNPDELVHHKDGNKHNNALKNLEVMSAVDHGRLHNLKHPISKPCVICGIIFTPHKTKRARAQTCSKECKIKLVSQKVRRPNAVNSKYREDAYPSQIKARL